MTWVWAVLAIVLAFLGGVFGGGAVGVKLGRTKAEKDAAELDRDQLVEGEKHDSELIREIRRAESLPDSIAARVAVRAAALKAIDRRKHGHGDDSKGSI